MLIKWDKHRAQQLNARSSQDGHLTHIDFVLVELLHLREFVPVVDVRTEISHEFLVTLGMGSTNEA